MAKLFPSIYTWQNKTKGYFLMLSSLLLICLQSWSTNPSIHERLLLEELEYEPFYPRKVAFGVSATCPQLVGGVALGQWLHRGDGLWRYHA